MMMVLVMVLLVKGEVTRRFGLRSAVPSVKGGLSFVAE